MIARATGSHSAAPDGGIRAWRESGLPMTVL